MKRNITAIILILTLLTVAVLPLVSEQTAEAAPDWKQLYFDEIKAAIAFSKSFSWDTVDYNAKEYLHQLTKITLVDLNFDGMPEIFFEGWALAGCGNNLLRVKTVANNQLSAVYDGNIGNLKLFRSNADESLAYRLNNCDEHSGRVFVSKSTTPMNSGFTDAAIFANWVTLEDYDIGGTVFTFNNQRVSATEFDVLMSELPGYTEINFTPKELDYEDWSRDFNNRWTNITDADIHAFLDSYVSEVELFGTEEIVEETDNTDADDTGTNDNDRITPPNVGGEYITDEPGRNESVVTPDKIQEVEDEKSANDVIKDVISSMTPEQRESGNSLDNAAHFVERAVSRGARRIVPVRDGSSVVGSNTISDLAETANSIRDNAKSTLSDEGVVLLRDLRKDVTLVTNEREKLHVEFPDDVSGIDFDTLTIESSFASIMVNKKKMKQDSEITIRNLAASDSDYHDGQSDAHHGRDEHTDSVHQTADSRFTIFGVNLIEFWSVGAIVFIIIIWCTLYAMNHKFKAWVLPTFIAVAVVANVATYFFLDLGKSNVGGLGTERITESVEVTMSEGMSAILSLPASEREKDTLVLFNEDGVPLTSKFNPVMGTIDAMVTESGVYTLREHTVDFSDIQDKDSSMREAIVQLASRDIMSGATASQFNPDDLITRAEFVSAIVRVFDMLDTDAVSSFSDVSRSDWYYSAVATAESENVIGGFDDNTFRGDMDILKDYLVTVTGNMLIEQMGYIVPQDIEAELQMFSDRDEIENWAEGQVALATQSNILIYRVDGTFAPQSTMTRGDAAIILYRVFNKVW